MWKWVKYIFFLIVGASLLKGISILLFGVGPVMWIFYVIALVIWIIYLRNYYISKM